MRDRIASEREMNEARQDLEDRLAELKRTVRQKIDLPARARVAVARRVEGARRMARERPLIPIALAATLIVLLALVFVWRRRAT